MCLITDVETSNSERISVIVRSFTLVSPSTAAGNGYYLFVLRARSLFFFLLIFKDEGKSEILLRPMFWTCLWWQLKEISYCNRTDCSPEMFFMLLDRDMTNIINMSHTYIKHDSAMRRQGLLLKSCCSPQNTKFPWMQVFDHWCCPVVSGPWLLFVNQAKLLKNKQKDPEKGSDK